MGTRTHCQEARALPIAHIPTLGLISGLFGLGCPCSVSLPPGEAHGVTTLPCDLWAHRRGGRWRGALQGLGRLGVEKQGLLVPAPLFLLHLPSRLDTGEAPSWTG